MRLFITLNLPAELRARVATDVLAPLRADSPNIRWVREETLHITLAFLGERREAGAHEVRAVVRKIAASHHPFGVSLTGLGVFPSPARPRVVWLGLADPVPVHELFRALERERVRLELPAEERAYHPHVTLGRVPPHTGREVSARLAPALSAVQFEALVTFSSLDLMHSELTLKDRVTQHSSLPRSRN